MGGGLQWKLAIAHDLSPSLLSATVSGARRCDYDARVVRIGVFLGLVPDEVFVDEDAVEPEPPATLVAP